MPPRPKPMPTGAIALMLTALDAAQSRMRLDACRAWTLRGKRGYLATWGDGHRWFIYCCPGTIGKWNRMRQALSPLGRCTQDGDAEGIIRLDTLPTPEQAALIRKAIGLVKRPVQAIEAMQANVLRMRAAVSRIQGPNTSDSIMAGRGGPIDANASLRSDSELIPEAAE